MFGEIVIQIQIVAHCLIHCDLIVLHFVTLKFESQHPWLCHCSYCAKPELCDPRLAGPENPSKQGTKYKYAVTATNASAFSAVHICRHEIKRIGSPATGLPNLLLSSQLGWEESKSIRRSQVSAYEYEQPYEYMEHRRKASADLEAASGSGRPRKRARVNIAVPESDSEMNGNNENSVKGNLRRTELIILMEQALANLGFTDVSQRLAAESGVSFQSKCVELFRQAILGGEYGEAVLLMDHLGLRDRQAVKQAKFLILEQRFLEDLNKGHVNSALQVLQQDLADLKIQRPQLHKLAGCLLCTSQQALVDHIAWAGTKGFKNREKLLRDLQEVIPPDVMLPEGRLETLLEQALTQQLNTVDNNRAPVQMPVSLLTDYSFSRSHIPTLTTQVLTDHTEEVWHIQFSHDGRFLASASKDASAIIWEVTSDRQVVKRHMLRGHCGSLTFCAWSPDDSMLATCSMDHLVKVWDVASGLCRRTIDRHDGPATTVSWLPDGMAVLTSAEDKNIHLSHLDSSNKVLSWNSDGVNELIMLNDGRLLMTPYGENKVEVWNLVRDPTSEQSFEPLVVEGDCIVSCSVSRDGSRMLLNMASRAVHLWKIPGPESQEAACLLQRFRGPKERQSRYVVRSCFGGYNDCYVLSGSEECKVFVWHSTSGELLAALEGHSGTVNSVSWNPRDHHMFASASDDKSIHIWGLDPEASSSKLGSPLTNRSGF